jgi:hypothetical protein
MNVGQSGKNMPGSRNEDLPLYFQNFLLNIYKIIIISKKGNP